MTDHLGQRLSCVLVVFTLLFAQSVHAQPTDNPAFTDQGMLRDNGATIDDLCDFQFTLMDAALRGTALAGPITFLSIEDANSLITDALDFGSSVIDGSNQWLEIEVRHPAGGGLFETLSPRQRQAPAPIVRIAHSRPESLWQFNGVRLYDNDGYVGLVLTPIYALHMASGSHCTTGGTWTYASSRDLKENFQPVDQLDVLKCVVSLPITRWNYKAEADVTIHIGPMAEDFSKAFNVGDSDKAISTVDADGVALACIQALYEIIREKEEDIRLLRAEQASLESRLARLEAMLGNGYEPLNGK
ncbi:MAG: tail fiber domain-containing protein [Planctomycetota bacterium]|nr:tail fiber domain-containing protein [Planctomycetota bacterium]